MNTLTSRRAFTLIELLIVVAIIAILAAIAVPNFLEAQVRAKVSRVKNDARAVATAMDTYYVDNNSYPPQGPITIPTYPFITDPTRVFGGDDPARHAPNNPPVAYHLSTPISYLSSTTSVFADPFFQGFQINGTNIVNDTRYYNYSGDYYGGRTYVDAATDGAIPDFENLSRILSERNGWHIRSRGPDGDYERRSDGWGDFLRWRGEWGQGSTAPDGGQRSVYDPTNGTTSGGDISRFGKGGIND